MSDIISDKRKPVKSPETLISDGKAAFGTFDAPIKNINMLDCSRPVGIPMPKILKTTRLKRWEAYEINLKDGFLLGAIYSVGVFCFTVLVFFDRTEQKTLVWQNFAPPWKIDLASTLIDSVSELKIGKNAHIRFENKFEEGKAIISGKASDKELGEIEAAFTLESIAPPSVVSIPLGKRHPLYTHKEFFRASGMLKIGDRVIESDLESTAIIDDHKGYYPYRMHYDWVTAFGMLNGKPLAFNLTANQSANPEDYNENLVWIEGKSFALPPVKFEKSDNEWLVSDEHGMVSVRFKHEGYFKMNANALVMRTKYTAPFGKVSGYVKCAESGETYTVDGLFGMGEDKTVRV